MEPVISSAATRPRTSLPTALSGRAITRMLVPGGRVPLLRRASAGVTSRQTAVRPGCAMGNSSPAGCCARKLAHPPVAARSLRKSASSAEADDGAADSTPTERVAVL